MSARETAPPRSREEIEAFIRTALDIPAHRTYGLECVSWAQGEATLAFHAGEAALGPSGSVHGGVVAMLLEPAAVTALIPLLPADRYAATVDMHVQQMRPVRPGARVLLKARVLRLGANLAFCEAYAEDDGKTCAAARLTKAIIKA